MSTSAMSALRRRIAIGFFVAVSGVFTIAFVWRVIEAMRGGRAFPYLGAFGGVAGMIVVWRAVLADRRYRAPAPATPTAR